MSDRIAYTVSQCNNNCCCSRLWPFCFDLEKYTEINLLLWDWKNNKLKVFWILQNLCLGNKFLWISKFVRIKCRRKKVLLTKIYLVWFTSLMLTKHSVWIKFIKLIKILIIFRKRFAVESFTYKSRLFGTICTNHLKTIKVYEA